MFELNPEKIEIELIVSRGSKKRTVTHELRNPKGKEWIKYDQSLSVAMENAPEGEGIRYLDNAMTAACRLWDDISLSVSGYAPGDLPENWKELVPPEHKKAAIIELTLVWTKLPREDDLESIFLLAGQETVILNARRGMLHEGLSHTFRSPSPEQRIMFSRFTSDSYLIKGTNSKQDRIVFPSSISEIIKLYDALIESVGGYTLDGGECIGRDDIVRRMDAQHKRVAIQELMKADRVELSESGKSAQGAA